MTRKRLLTGDRPTGKLHLGHYVGSVANRVRLQDEYECYFLIADLHLLTTKNRREDIDKIRQFAIDIVTDYMACG
ncbi:MAG: tryptophan--tRNA ligase, partial [Candidatus Promineifilaceae bacterium]